MKILPKKLLKTNYTYEDYFYSIKTKNNTFEEILDQFRLDVVNKRGIKTYDQGESFYDSIIIRNLSYRQ